MSVRLTGLKRRVQPHDAVRSGRGDSGSSGNAGTTTGASVMPSKRLKLSTHASTAAPPVFHGTKSKGPTPLLSPFIKPRDAATTLTKKRNVLPSPAVVAKTLPTAQTSKTAMPRPRPVPVDSSTERPTRTTRTTTDTTKGKRVKVVFDKPGQRKETPNEVRA